MAVAEAVRTQLGHVQLGPFDPLAFSSRCHETIEVSCALGGCLFVARSHAT